MEKVALKENSRFVELNSEIVIAEKWNVFPCKGVIVHKTDKNCIKFSFEIKFGVDASDSLLIQNSASRKIIDYTNLTRIKLIHIYEMPPLARKDLYHWSMIDCGGFEIAHEVRGLVNILIDHILVNHKRKRVKTEKYDIYPHLRHIGPADMVYISCKIAKNNKEIVSISSGGLFPSSVKKDFVYKINNRKLSNEYSDLNLQFLRAVELLNRGYSTESFLVAFALLDKFVQEDIKKRLELKSIENPEKVIRSVKENRLGYYLDPLLKLLSKRSLRIDSPAIWYELTNENTGINRIRNKIIHNSENISYKEASEYLETIRKIINYTLNIDYYDLTKKIKVKKMNEIPPLEILP